jgi:hypothetical protein
VKSQAEQVGSARTEGAQRVHEGRPRAGQGSGRLVEDAHACDGHAGRELEVGRADDDSRGEEEAVGFEIWHLVKKSCVLSIVSAEGPKTPPWTVTGV